MSNVIRKNKIIELVRECSECSVDLLIKEFGVSGMTIRRDLQELANEGKIIRTHGGATSAQKVTFEFNFLNRSQNNSKEKVIIATKAAELVGNARIIMLGAGTTTLELARHLKGIDGLTIITTSLPIASELQFCDKIEVLLLGGFLRQGSPDLTGALTESNLESLHADIAFLGADAIDQSGGIYDNEISVGNMLKRMVSASSSVYAVADHTKIGKKALTKYSSLSAWNGLITDAGISKEHKTSLEQNGVKTIIAG